MILKIYILLFSLNFASELSDRYYNAMDKGIKMFESCKTEEDFLKTSNYFYRISQVSKNDWLSSYYYAYCNTSLSMMQDDTDIKELYLNKAYDIIAPFDSLKINNVIGNHVFKDRRFAGSSATIDWPEKYKKMIEKR